jgi:hypothetical protein
VDPLQSPATQGLSFPDPPGEEVFSQTAPSRRLLDPGWLSLEPRSLRIDFDSFPLLLVYLRLGIDPPHLLGLGSYRGTLAGSLWITYSCLVRYCELVLLVSIYLTTTRVRNAPFRSATSKVLATPWSRFSRSNRLACISSLTTRSSNCRTIICCFSTSLEICSGFPSS